MRRGLCILAALSLVVTFAGGAWAHSGVEIEFPKLPFKPTIDGDISEWEEFAWTDGPWTLDRLQAAPEFSACTGLRDIVDDQGVSNEPDGTATTPDDLTSEYWLAWDDEGIWAGVRTIDNVHDVSPSNGLASRWPWKDSCSWYMDMPHDADGGPQAQGDHIWSFVSEVPVIPGNRWWRHGEGDETNIEVPAPANVLHEVILGGGAYDVNYEMEMFMPWDNMLALTPSFNVAEGAVFGWTVVQTDPDGTTPDGGDIGDSGGQFCVWGNGATDEEYADGILVPGEDVVAVQTSTWVDIKQLFR